MGEVAVPSSFQMDIKGYLPDYLLKNCEFDHDFGIVYPIVVGYKPKHEKLINFFYSDH